MHILFISLQVMSVSRLLESSDLVVSLGIKNLVVQNLVCDNRACVTLVVSASSKIFTVLPKLNDATGWFFS